MTNTNNTTTKRTFKHLNDILRGRIEELAKSGYTQVQIAKEIGVNQSTISRELRRGRTIQMKYNRTYHELYLADAGSRIYKENRQFSHAKDYSKYSKNFFIELQIALKSTKNHPRIHSVDTFVYTYKKNHPDERVPCSKTVYNLIDKGVLSIRNIDLPKKLRMRPRKKYKTEPSGTNVKRLGTSIEERDSNVLTRSEFGHWEVDLVIGKKTKGEPVIITLIERQTRDLLTRKVWSKDAAVIQNSIRKMVIKEGIAKFKSITTDNGSEFSTLSLLEQDFKDLKIYFAHAYASWEKGTNERHNGLLREFIPKGYSLKGLKYKELQMYTDALNNRPRKILGYKTPFEMYNTASSELEIV